LRDDGIVDKIVRDEVIGLFFGISGPSHGAAAVAATLDLGRADGPEQRHAIGADPGGNGGPHR
jgi:adenylate cyclase